MNRLQADAARDGHTDLDLFGRFVGSWKLDWSRPGDPDAPSRLQGELYFGWVLAGRAVQDVRIVSLEERLSKENQRWAFHGSTIRFFDSALGARRSTWVEPMTGRVRKFIGRSEGNEIHLISTDDDPYLRWRFTEIGDDRFVWLGEFSTDEARTWQPEERVVAIRQR